MAKIPGKRLFVSVVIGFLSPSFAGCSNDREAKGAESTVVETQASAPISVTSIAEPASTSIAEPNCESHRPADFPTVVSAEQVTISDLRAIRIGTLPPEPTQLLLADHLADEAAVICVAYNGASSYSTYWVASGGEVGALCISTYGEGAIPLAPGRDC